MCSIDVHSLTAFSSLVLFLFLSSSLFPSLSQAALRRFAAARDDHEPGRRDRGDAAGERKPVLCRDCGGAVLGL